MRLDISLRITEPSGEICHSFHNHTRSGGILSRDFTSGYGPVVHSTSFQFIMKEYQVKVAPKGRYGVDVVLFGSQHSATVCQERYGAFLKN
jgi:Ca-activated chloride channel family protein